MAPLQNEPSRRLFFALWPPDESRAALVEATHSVVSAATGAGAGTGTTGAGRAVLPENLHVTLAFLGSVPERRLEEVVAIGAQVADEDRVPAFEVVFDRVEYWRKPGILCATASAAPPEAITLAADLKSQLTAAGFAPDPKPFRAHVTLARKVTARPGQLVNPREIRWPMAEFSLVESQTHTKGSVYSVVRSYRL
jgi:RNA 2',3'-cyclic 3'-phosphodiesterase